MAEQANIKRLEQNLHDEAQAREKLGQAVATRIDLLEKHLRNETQAREKLDQQLAALRHDYTPISSDVDAAEADVSDLTRRVNDDSIIASVERQEILSYISDLERQVQVFSGYYEQELSSLDEDRANIEEIYAGTDTLINSVDTINADVVLLQNTATTINATLVTMENAVDTINANTVNLVNNVNSIEADVVSINNNIGTIQADVVSITTDISGLSSRMTTVEVTANNINVVNIAANSIDVVNINGEVFHTSRGNQALFDTNVTQENQIQYLTTLLTDTISDVSILSSTVSSNTSAASSAQSTANTALSTANAASANASSAYPKAIAVESDLDDLKDMWGSNTLLDRVNSNTNALGQKANVGEVSYQAAQISCLIGAMQSFHGSSGGCYSFVAGTSLHTNEGIIPIERVQAGMRVWRPVSYGPITAMKLETVLDPIGLPLEEGSLISVKLDNGDLFQVTTEHKFAVSRRGHLRLVPAILLQPQDKLWHLRRIGPVAVRSWCSVLNVNETPITSTIMIYNLNTPSRMYLVGSGVLSH